jgi:hypothetical protein
LGYSEIIRNNSLTSTGPPHVPGSAIRATASKHAPWFVVPADKKWFTRLVVAAAIVMTVENFDLTFPEVDAEKEKELTAARAALASET